MNQKYEILREPLFTVKEELQKNNIDAAYLAVKKTNNGNFPDPYKSGLLTDFFWSKGIDAFQYLKDDTLPFGMYTNGAKLSPIFCKNGNLAFEHTPIRSLAGFNFEGQPDIKIANLSSIRSINDYPFQNCENLKTVIINADVLKNCPKTIGDWAWNCESWKKLLIKGDKNTAVRNLILLAEQAAAHIDVEWI